MSRQCPRRVQLRRMLYRRSTVSEVESMYSGFFGVGRLFFPHSLLGFCVFPPVGARRFANVPLSRETKSGNAT